MKLMLMQFILGMVFFLLSCNQPVSKSTPKKPKLISEIDTVLFLAYPDSTFLKITDKDTTGYAIDFLNRFSEETNIPFKLIICQNATDVLDKFSQKKGNLFLQHGLHDSISLNDGLLQSNSLVERKLQATSSNLNSFLQDNFSILSRMHRTIENLFYRQILPSDSFLTCHAKFRMHPRDSLFLISINNYIQNVAYRADIAFLKNHYFGLSLPLNMKKYRVPRFTNGSLSPYDKIFKEVAEKYGWDWKLLAAISFKESRFNPTIIGGGGAFGLMQFMPSVAKKYGINANSTPQQQILAGMKLLNNAFKAWGSIPNQEQRIKFTLASYNAGKAHIDDAQRLAEKHGLNPTVWDGNVQLMVNNLSLAKYYNDEVVKFGAYHGQADRYANLVYQIYLSWKVQK